jgi:rubredoxin
MNAGMHRATEQMVGQFRSWVKGLAEDAARIQDGSGLNALERRMREQGQALLAQTFQGLLQVAMDALPASRTCPRCGGRRRHKGRRERGLISSLGAIRLEGVYWHCPQCGGQHSLEALSGGSASGVMRELLCLLGTSMASFAKAEMASVKLLGVRVSKAYILRLCRREGRSVALRPVEMDAEHPTDLIGSCDGTMVNTTQKGWKELKAYQQGDRDAVANGRADYRHLARLAACSRGFSGRLSGQRIEGPVVGPAVLRGLGGLRRPAGVASPASRQVRRAQTSGGGGGVACVLAEERRSAGLPHLQGQGLADLQWDHGKLLQATRPAAQGPRHAVVHCPSRLHDRPRKPLDQ